ncbi:hypothetical protein AMS68_005568 [Peltaster fructicola]|uniref:Uncharacterized protein n=1 Tax=Peltaster fructicola TaxID=286661 RepID=A0A6H0XZF2_9PEZI|nr:hypothetical protein AMS68_005568 [Peltaster fructicola]
MLLSSSSSSISSSLSAGPEVLVLSRRQKRSSVSSCPTFSPSFHSFNSSRHTSTARAAMASAAVTATMAAAGFDKRNSTSTSCSSNLQTPGSGTFPSAMRSPSLYSPGFLRKEDAMKTPLTPPSAYLDFLKNIPPALMSPMPTSTSSRFNFNEKSSNTLEPALSTGSTPATQPALSRNTSYSSEASTTSSSTTVSEQSITTTTTTQTNNKKNRPESPRIIVPPSPFVKPGPRSARTPRRLQIPQSPYSPAMNTANSAQSPLSATPWSASFSPRDADPEVNGKPGRVSVRHVVTRTVTYCRTPLEPAPRGKRRKLEEPSSSSSQKIAEIPSIVSEDDATPKKSDVAAIIKQETGITNTIAPELQS